MEVQAPHMVSTDTAGEGTLIITQPDQSPASQPSLTPLGRGAGKGLGCSLQPEVEVSAPHLALAGGGGMVFPVLFCYRREMNTESFLFS